jgi:hypothetical protein
VFLAQENRKQDLLSVPTEIIKRRLRKGESTNINMKGFLISYLSFSEEKEMGVLLTLSAKGSRL